MATEAWSERHTALIALTDKLYSARSTLVSFWNESAQNFFPERATFFSTSLTEQFAGDLSTSFPLMVRRSLGDAISSMLRVDDWFNMSVNVGDDRLDNAGKSFLEFATKVQRGAMYDRAAMFTRATKQCDHDYATFGQGVLSVEAIVSRAQLLYRNWHLRDVAWCTNAYGEIDIVSRKWEDCTAKDCLKLFPRTTHDNVRKMVTDNNGKQAYDHVKLRHIVLRSEDYDGPYGGPQAKMPYVGIFLDPVNKVVLEEMPRRTRYYMIPRWMLLSESQYAFSPAVTCALPDARVLQAMTYTLLTAAEKATNPPMIAVMDAIRSNIDILPGGVTAVEAEYDERLGEVLRPITQDYRGLPTGMNMSADQRAQIEAAFYLNRLSMPPVTHEMTAEEARLRVADWMRDARALFDPAEQEYNALICETTTEELLAVNAFGPPENIPESLQGKDVRFKFKSPIADVKEGELARTFLDAKAMLVEGAELDPAVPKMLNTQKALRDALKGRTVPSEWLKDEREMEDVSAAMAQEQAAAKQLQVVNMGGQAAEQAGKAGMAIKEAQAA
jgi:hypothetical protein